MKKIILVVAVGVYMTFGIATATDERPQEASSAEKRLTELRAVLQKIKDDPNASTPSGGEEVVEDDFELTEQTLRSIGELGAEDREQAEACLNILALYGKHRAVDAASDAIVAIGTAHPKLHADTCIAHIEKIWKEQGELPVSSFDPEEINGRRAEAVKDLKEAKEKV